MERESLQPPHIFLLKLDPSGRVVLPHPLREKLHVAQGDDIVLIEDGDSFRLETPEQSLRQAQAYFRSLVPPGTSVVDELLAERRIETAGE